MWFNVSITLLCVCFASGTLFMDRERYLKEIDEIDKNLSVYDDDGNPVKITMEEGRSLKWFTGHVSFTLYTRHNRSTPLVTNDRTNLNSSDFDCRRPTRFITHGWTQTGRGDSCVLIRDAYLEANDDNVIVVDWSSTSQAPYIWAARHVDDVGIEVAQMIDFLVEKGNLNVDKTTLVGHSLGAHVMGLAGYHSKYIIRHVVGLDPALPMFRFVSDLEKLSTKSGKHVEIIHTNAGVLGYLWANGHSDFYPNQGRAQRGCCESWDLFDCYSCSHGRAYEYFAESITSIFEGSQCYHVAGAAGGFCRFLSSTEIMGGASFNLKKPGIYYLMTGAQAPFSKVH